jgi:hypothetical protein
VRYLRVAAKQFSVRGEKLQSLGEWTCLHKALNFENIDQEKRGFRTYTKFPFLLIDNLEVKLLLLNTAALLARPPGRHPFVVLAKFFLPFSNCESSNRGYQGCTFHN